MVHHAAPGFSCHCAVLPGGAEGVCLCVEGGGGGGSKSLRLNSLVFSNLHSREGRGGGGVLTLRVWVPTVGFTTPPNFGILTASDLTSISYRPPPPPPFLQF